MKHTIRVKILVSLVVVLLALVSLYLLRPNHNATNDGSFSIEIIDINETLLYEGELTFISGDSFYNVLSKYFTLMCANANYEIDETCSYEFNFITHKDRIILGIKNDNFEMISDWFNTFIAFYYEKDGVLFLTNYGVNHIPYENGDKFVIKLESVRNN